MQGGLSLKKNPPTWGYTVAIHFFHKNIPCLFLREEVRSEVHCKRRVSLEVSKISIQQNMWKILDDMGVTSSSSGEKTFVVADDGGEGDNIGSQSQRN